MTDLSVFRARLRRDLHDEDAADYRWSDEALGRHLARAVLEYSLASPLAQTSVLPTQSGSRELAISSLAALAKVYAVEYPLGCFPASFQRFSLWGTILTLLGDRLPSGDDCRIFWGQLHTLDESGSTLPAAHEDVVVLGAAAFAALEQAVYTTNRLSLGGAPQDYARLGAAWLADFRRHLRGLRGGLKVARLYRAASAVRAKATDYGP